MSIRKTLVLMVGVMGVAGCPTLAGSTGNSVDDLVYPYRGSDIIALGRIDSDTADDYAILRTSFFSLSDPVRIVSGKDGTTIRIFAPDFDGDTGQAFAKLAANVGDIDGDGRDDLALSEPTWSSPPGGRVIVVSPSTGATLLVVPSPAPNIRFGQSGIVGLGDVDDDGVPDFLVRDLPTATVREKLYVYSGRTGVLLYSRQFSSPPTGNRKLCALTDLDGDGARDVVIVEDGHSADAYSGRTGEVLAHVWQTPPGASIRGMTSIGDLNADGVRDLAIGFGFTAFPGSTGTNLGWIQIVSGASLEELATFRGPILLGPIGAHLEDGGDIDGDGVSDLLAEGGSPGRSFVISGRNLELIGKISSTSTTTAPGLRRVGDVDGDGKCEIGVLYNTSVAIWDAIAPFQPCWGDIKAPAGVVNASDLALLLACWGVDQYGVDQNGDGVIDGADIASLLGAWGSCMP